MRIIARYIGIIVCTSVILVACNKTDTSTSCSYDKDVKPFVMAKCAVAGCHVAGFAPGDFTRFEIVKAKADAGRIHTNVFDLEIMPPQTMDSLTNQEKNKLKCWLDNGALQN